MNPDSKTFLSFKTAARPDGEPETTIDSPSFAVPAELSLWQDRNMTAAAKKEAAIQRVITPRVVSGLYVEAMLLADEVRAYFDELGHAERDALPPVLRVSFSCESVKITTRLMHIMTWLLAHRSAEVGDEDWGASFRTERRLARETDSDARDVALLPERAQALIRASCELYQRLARLEASFNPDRQSVSPVRNLMGRLETAF